VLPSNDEEVENDVISGFATKALHRDYKKTMETSARNYYDQFKKVVAASDIVLQILDARDPEGTRSQQVEDIVKQASKHLVLVINKSDLPPRRT